MKRTLALLVLIAAIGCGGEEESTGSEAIQEDAVVVQSCARLPDGVTLPSWIRFECPPGQVAPPPVTQPPPAGGGSTSSCRIDADVNGSAVSVRCDNGSCTCSRDNVIVGRCQEVPGRCSTSIVNGQIAAGCCRF